ncbi:unnamed protein product [Paramecium sonneborni]|uniref:Uncharacterized protein n=1 Tax=Paramecium sonneborni TaxID=65129 RepID=A0A8S1KG63_9CILI|nr:unnamed protein product [Paramecium sonneborni]
MLEFQSCNPSSTQQSDLQVLNSQSSTYLIQALNQFPQQLQQKVQEIQQENQKLKNENQLLQQSINQLENKQQEFINEILDLRQLIKRVYQEGEVSFQFLSNKNVILKHQNDSLDKALKNLQNNIHMFGQLKDISQLIQQKDDH